MVGIVVFVRVLSDDEVFGDMPQRVADDAGDLRKRGGWRKGDAGPSDGVEGVEIGFLFVGGDEEAVGGSDEVVAGDVGEMEVECLVLGEAVEVAGLGLLGSESISHGLSGLGR